MIAKDKAYSRLGSAIVTRAFKDLRRTRNSFENRLDAFYFLLTQGDDYGEMLGYESNTKFSDWLLMGMPMPKLYDQPEPEITGEGVGILEAKSHQPLPEDYGEDDYEST